MRIGHVLLLGVQLNFALVLSNGLGGKAGKFNILFFSKTALLMLFSFYIWSTFSISKTNLIIGLCPDGYEDLIQGSSYCFQTIIKQLTWQESRNECRNMNGELATFHNEKEESYFLKRAYTSYWLGYKQLENASKCTNLPL